MDIKIKRVCEDEKWEVTSFLIDEQYDLLLELNPSNRLLKSEYYKNINLEVDKKILIKKINSDSVVYAAYEDEDIIGAGFIDETGYLDSLYVKEEYRNKTIGSQLLSHLIEDCDRLKIIKVDARLAAINLYRNFSFHEVDGDKNEAFISMELERSNYGK